MFGVSRLSWCLYLPQAHGALIYTTTTTVLSFGGIRFAQVACCGHHGVMYRLVQALRIVLSQTYPEETTALSHQQCIVAWAVAVSV